MILRFPSPDSSSAPSERERWDARYSAADCVFGKEPCGFLAEKIALLPKGKVLDLAMGEGRNALFLAREGFDVTGVDISPVAVAKAKRFAEEQGVRLRAIVADLAAYDQGEALYDAITNFYAFEPRLFPGIVRALKPGGVFVFETFSIDHLEVGGSFGPRNPAFLVKPNELLKRLEALRILFYEDTVVELDNGRHKGPAALVRLIARKPAD